MHRLSVRHFLWSAAAAALLAPLAAGCHDGHAAGSCKDIPPGAIPQPNGEYLCEWTNAQRDRAEADRLVIYEYEWSADPVRLTTGGQEHIARMVRVLGQSAAPVMIESSPDRSTNELRRNAVLEALAAAGCPTNPARVVCGRPEAEGLYGEEATNVAREMFSNQGGQGGSAGGGSSLGGGGGASGGIGGSSGLGSSGGGSSY